MSEILISVLTPTIRPEGLAIVKNGLEAQTFPHDAFEWIVEVGLPSQGHHLNRDYNRMLRRAQGELIVSLQDYIAAPALYLDNFWDAYQRFPKTMFTAPVGKVDNWEQKEARWDWRAYEDAKPKWDCWEIDSGAAPMQMFKDVGGFDEALDQWWSFDNVSVAMRAELLGWRVKNIHDNPSLALDHDKKEKHPFRDRFRPALVQMRMDSYKENPILEFLKAEIYYPGSPLH